MPRPGPPPPVHGTLDGGLEGRVGQDPGRQSLERGKAFGPLGQCTTDHGARRQDPAQPGQTRRGQYGSVPGQAPEGDPDIRNDGEAPVAAGLKKPRSLRDRGQARAHRMLVGGRPQRPHRLFSGHRGGEAGNVLQDPVELEDLETAPDSDGQPSSSRTIADAARPSKRPRMRGMSPDITAPMWFAPPAISSRTISRTSSAPSSDGR